VWRRTTVGIISTATTEPIPSTRNIITEGVHDKGYGSIMRRQRIAGRCARPCDRRPRCDEFCRHRLSGLA
jgi:hypothetical protein